MDVDVYQDDGVEAGRTATLDPTIFDIEPNNHVIWLDVKRIQAHERQGTNKTKERSEVRGSTRKLYRQKGTGNARVGDAQSPIRRGGGRAHGARPRSYDHDLNRKEKRLARRSALAYKAQDDAVRVVDLKAYYEGTDVDTPVDADFYRRVVEGLPEAIVEDAAITDETRPVFEGQEDRLSWDYPITGISSIEALPVEPEVQPRVRVPC